MDDDTTDRLDALGFVLEGDEDAEDAPYCLTVGEGVLRLRQPDGTVLGSVDDPVRLAVYDSATGDQAMLEIDFASLDAFLAATEGAD